MNKLFLPILLTFFILFSCNVQAQSLFNVYLDANETTVSSLMAFHESSESISWYIRANPSDSVSYDNHTIDFDCGGAIFGSFSTNDYETWNNFGYITIGLEYETLPYTISYNEIIFTANYLRCEFIVDTGSFVNNSAYDHLIMELIPLESSIEFIDCSAITSPQIALAGEIEMFVTIASNFWTIVWIIVSIFVIVFAVIGIPAWVFMLIRYVMFRITGHRIGGNAR